MHLILGSPINEMKLFSYLLIMISFLSCSDDNVWTKNQLWNRGREVDPGLKIVLPDSLKDGIKCQDYGKGCLNGFMVEAMGLRMILVKFETQEQARLEALRIDGYYSRNWVFDDTAGEPRLERFVKKVCNAIRPLEEEKKKESLKD